MRILIIAESSTAAQWLEQMFREEIPEATTACYDASVGKPLRTFNWSAYDVVLMAHREGLAWLGDFVLSTDFPPAVFVSESADDSAALAAKELGAHDVLGKRELSPAALASATLAAIEPSTIQQAEGADDFSWASFASTYARDTATDGYKFVRLIGQGAMSKVYLAERLSDGQTVVLKVLDKAMVRREENVRRFVREASLISDIYSPYVVTIYEHGFTNTYGYICMEFFSRGDLQQRLEHGIDPRLALLYALNIAYGLDAIHRIGIVHRDLKPANIMFRADDSLALADFGICKPVDASMDLTIVGSIIGTPFYMSPEQARSDAVDVRSDLYSLGVMLYEMLTGEKPFRGNSMGAVIYQHLHADIPRLPPALMVYQPLVDAFLAKDPEDRVQTAGDAVAMLRTEALAA